MLIVLGYNQFEDSYYR